MKRYRVDIKNKDGTRKQTLKETEVLPDINFTENINGTQWNATINVKRNFNDDQVSNGDFVEVLVVDSNFPNGKKIYTGVIEEINRVFTESSNQVEFSCFGLGTLLTNVFYDSSGKIFSKDEDPWVTIQNIISYANSVIPWNWFDSSGVELFWSNVSQDYDYTTCYQSIKNLAQITGFYFFVDADGLVTFKQKGSDVDHLLTVGNDVSSVSISQDATKVKNKVYVEYNWGTVIQTGGSVPDLLLREQIERDQGLNLASAQDLSQSLIDNTGEKQKTSVVVNVNFAFENIKVWQIVSVRNIDYPLKSLQVRKTSYTSDLLTIELDEFDSVEKVFQNFKN